MINAMVISVRRPRGSCLPALHHEVVDGPGAARGWGLAVLAGH